MTAPPPPDFDEDPNQHTSRYVVVSTTRTIIQDACGHPRHGRVACERHPWLETVVMDRLWYEGLEADDPTLHAADGALRLPSLSLLNVFYRQVLVVEYIFERTVMLGNLAKAADPKATGISMQQVYWLRLAKRRARAALEAANVSEKVRTAFQNAFLTKWEGPDEREHSHTHSASCSHPH
ncbi:hypothetical protein JCM10908_005716 [Rhodotorula pacifica]|uniref:uncharacterized protein n=1 Tax=Rhodotorula pacifica TaxID=1495444 RepID=UPI00317C7C6A